ncbi:MAG: protein disulfide oxidoreductase [Sulfurimonas sp.]|nr:MAG: protein disulfide oxidoreductase [Sulfurimonas sp.]
MKKKLKKYIKEIITFSIFMIIASNLISLYKSSDLNDNKLTNTYLELLDGSFYSQDNNKPILIHFWASWCPTCKLEAKNIQYISENFQVLSIAVKSGSAYDVQKYLDKNDLTYYTHNDKNAKLASMFNVVAYPTTFIYDKNKNLVFSEVGYTSTLGLWLRMWWASY